MAKTAKAELVPAETAQLPEERESGVARLQKEELYYLSGLASAALYEAERLVTEVQRDACRIPSTGERPTIDVEEARSKAREALICAESAEHYLRILLSDPQPF